MLKSHLPVVLLLAGNVFFHLFQIRLTDRKPYRESGNS
jgi:hypothetical protein